MFSELCSGRDGQILVDQGGFCEEIMQGILFNHNGIKKKSITKNKKKISGN